jgi:tetratricopeptide (TPR) repeat protein
MAEQDRQQPKRKRPQSGRTGGGTGQRGDASKSKGSARRSQQGRSGGGQRREGERQQAKPRRRDLQGAAANLPNWVVESLERVTPDKRVPGALQALGEASEAFADGAYQRAMRKAQKAKDLAPRDATIREILGLAAYRLGDWQVALAELRTFRRLAGETTHLPVEIDALRAMGRPNDVESAWQTLQQRGGRPAVMKEGRVVYASFLIDEGRLDEASKLVMPQRTSNKAFPEDLRLWYVAARAAALMGDAGCAAELRNAILQQDPAFPGIDELERLIASA